MKFSSKRLFFCLSLFAVLDTGATMAETKKFVGCPLKSWTTWEIDGGLSIHWAFSGQSAIVAFQPDGIVLGGGLAPLTPEQARAYEPTLNELRLAAVSRRSVDIYFDPDTRRISAFIVNWHDGC